MAAFSRQSGKDGLADATGAARPSAPCPTFECEPPRPFQDPALGVVLTGGGAFGAWEAGALEALFDFWKQKYGKEPPIRLVVGTSTGALIAPFVALGRDAVTHVADAYQGVTDKDIYAFTIPNLLKWQSLYDWGFPASACETRGLLYENYAKILKSLQLPDMRDALRALVDAWASPTDRKVVAATSIDFATGAEDYVMNGPADLPPGESDEGLYCSRFYNGVFASTVPPLFGPPTPLRNRVLSGSLATPHFDGGPYQEAPFDVFFQIQKDQKIPLTHVVLVSSYPLFPGSDARPAQSVRFPNDPHIGEIAARFDSVLSEAAVSSLTRLACLTLQLHAAGHDPQHIRQRTGIQPPHTAGGPVPQLVSAFPCERMGFDPNRFEKTEMGEMRQRGKRQALPVFQKYF